MKGKCCACIASILILVAATVIGIIMVVNNGEDIWINRELSSITATSVKQLPQEIQTWHAKGHYLKINGFNMFYILLNIRKTAKTKTNSIHNGDPGNSTLILIHGYPTSSFDYHRSLDNHLIPYLRQQTGDYTDFILYRYLAMLFTVIVCNRKICKEKVNF